MTEIIKEIQMYYIQQTTISTSPSWLSVISRNVQDLLWINAHSE